ncbi:MAG: alanine--glyoxylate aminotransferase family protein [Pirellulales bacterium]
MPRKRLMTPGPTQVPEPARLAMARQVIHHRTGEFRALFAEVLAGLKYVFQTANDVVVLASSGTGAMEAAVVNLVPRGGKAIVLESGVFSRRWADICRRYGIQVVTHAVPWGQAIEADDVAHLLAKHPDALAVFGTLMESSTGVGHDVEAIGRVIGPSDAFWVVDGISGTGAMRCLTDAWHIDVLVVGSQKALMIPPGLAFLSVSPAAWQQIERVEQQAFFFDLKWHRDKLQGASPDTPWTPAVTLIAGLAESLQAIRGEGIEAVWDRCALLSAAAIAGMQAMGLEIFAARPAAGMTAVHFPEGLDGAALLSRLETRFGIKLASGQLSLKGKIFRLAHFGVLDELDIIATLAAIEMALDDMGHGVTLGAAAAAAGRVMQARPGAAPHATAAASGAH